MRSWRTGYAVTLLPPRRSHARPGVNEGVLKAAMVERCLTGGSERMAYAPINQAQQAESLASGPGVHPPPPPACASPSSAALRRGWARLLRRVYEIDPLVCPRCRGVMRMVSFITEGRVIRRILDHIGASALRATQDRAPPVTHRSINLVPSVGRWARLPRQPLRSCRRCHTRSQCAQSGRGVGRWPPGRACSGRLDVLAAPQSV